MKKELNIWFKSLDSLTLSYIFPGLYEEIMESADPKRCTINHFYKEAKELWKGMSYEKQEEIYEQFKDA